jgi:hypothetical protein
MAAAMAMKPQQSRRCMKRIHQTASDRSGNQGRYSQRCSRSRDTSLCRGSLK